MKYQSAIIAASSCLVLAFAAAPGAAQTTEIVSVNSMGVQGGGFVARISGDGRFVAFSSDSPNLAPGVTNGVPDIFVHDRLTGETTRVSVSSSGEEANQASNAPSISADGRYVAFQSRSNNLDTVDMSFIEKIFVHDRQTGETEIVSVSSSGDPSDADCETPFISADGRYVAFLSRSTTLVAGIPAFNMAQRVFLHDRQTGETELISIGFNGDYPTNDCSSPSVSGDGRYVAYVTVAPEIVPGDTNFNTDAFVYDRMAGVTERVSVATGGAETGGAVQEAIISANGRFVMFDSFAADIVPGDTNAAADVFVHDRDTVETERVSVSSMGDEGDAGSLVVGSGGGISADGRYVLFRSFASNLVAGDTNGVADMFLHDRDTGETQRVNLTDAGAQIGGFTIGGGVSDDGRFAAFRSNAANVVPGSSGTQFYVRDVTGASPCPWDLTGSGDVGSADLAFLLGCWGPVTPGDGCAVADITNSGLVGSADLAEVLGSWGVCP